jgi:hypothetical protein
LAPPAQADRGQGDHVEGDDCHQRGKWRRTHVEILLALRNLYRLSDVPSAARCFAATKSGKHCCRREDLRTAGEGRRRWRGCRARHLRPADLDGDTRLLLRSCRLACLSFSSPLRWRTRPIRPGFTFPCRAWRRRAFTGFASAFTFAHRALAHLVSEVDDGAANVAALLVRRHHMGDRRPATLAQRFGPNHRNICRRLLLRIGEASVRWRERPPPPNAGCSLFPPGVLGGFAHRTAGIAIASFTGRAFATIARAEFT